ncbi:MAG: endonuclease III domain-containing protein [Candidatus Marsarchaeota archaeon]|jgi:endonuclease-3 related protein|nr:endonuclease III domain-containing protein [Candidatus Marsarchaeota archaeon]
MSEPEKSFSAIYLLLRNRFGFLNWWPGDTTDEIFIGAILTQNTSWRNVEKSIANLKSAGMLSIKSIAAADVGKIQPLIRPSGYYLQKALRLKNICLYITKNYGSLSVFLSQVMPVLRLELLSLTGIGPETADSIILYAAGKPIFVIDAYTRRTVQRVFGEASERKYADLQGDITRGIPRSISLYRDFHAQFVELGKNYCRKKPLCESCPLNGICRYAERIRATIEK